MLVSTGDFRITGNLVNAYFVCRRKLWFYSRQMNPDPDMDLLIIGRLISEESYAESKKEIRLEGMTVDLIDYESGGLVLCEVKKSSKEIYAARMQLLFYLNNLKLRGIDAKGEIRIPKERKRIRVDLTDEGREELATVIESIIEVCNDDVPPLPENKKKCKKCAFFELCFA